MAWYKERAKVFIPADIQGRCSTFTTLESAEIQKALPATGDERKAQGLAMEAVDLKLFYPKPFKQSFASSLMPRHERYFPMPTRFGQSHVRLY